MTKKKITAEKEKKLDIFLYQKVQFNLSLGLHKGSPRYRRSLQPSNPTEASTRESF
jgi:hypothetical protein